MKLLLKTSYFSSFLCSVTLTNPILREISYCPPLLHIYLQDLPWDFTEVLYALVNPAMLVKLVPNGNITPSISHHCFPFLFRI